MKIRQVAEVVKKVLTKVPSARDNDNLLICFVINEYGKEKANFDGKGFDWNMPFCKIMEAIDKGYCPCFESITRARRKLQSLYPVLNASQQVQDARLEKTSEYKSFNKDGRV